MKVGILGGGRWGQALARLAMAAGNEPMIAYRDERPPHILPSTRDAERVPQECELVLVATSAAQVRNAVRLARPGPRNRVVVAGRGLEPASTRWLADVVMESCDAVRVGALAGPAPVEEILSGGLCAGVVASPYEDVRRLAVAGLHSTRYRVYTSPDLVGVQAAGAAVPVLATLMGLATNLGGAGVGLHAIVIARGLEEMSRLAVALGGDRATLAGLAGLGDLVAVQSAPRHAYAQAGAALARRGTGPVGAPVALASALARLARAHRVELPLTEALLAIAEKGMDPVEVVGGLMRRESVQESA